MIVVDASALAEFLVDTPRGRLVGDRLERAGTIHIPHLAAVETASVFRRWVLSGQLETGLARQALRDLASVPAVRHPHEPFLDRVWALRANLSAYDGVYVALAEALESPLLTCDSRLSRAPLPGVAVELVTSPGPDRTSLRAPGDDAAS